MRQNRFVAPKLQSVTGTAPAAAMLFREASIQGRLVNLRAANDLGRYVRLVSGRLPTMCVPAHCEVLRLQGAGPIPSTPRLRLIEVGRAVLKPDAPFASFVLPAPPPSRSRARSSTTRRSRLPSCSRTESQASRGRHELETFYRSYGWFVPIARDVHPWAVDAFARKVQRLTAQIGASSDEFRGDRADRCDSRPRRRRRRSRPGACCSSAAKAAHSCCAFTILAAAALRRDVTDARRRLTWFGARRWQVELFTLAESIALATVGTVVGWAGRAAPSPR